MPQPFSSKSIVAPKYLTKEYKSLISSSCSFLKSLLVVVDDVLVVGAYQHCSHEDLLYSNSLMEFRHSSPEALHTKRRERPLLAKDGTKAKEI
jgi:hypothetical protein